VIESIEMASSKVYPGQSRRVRVRIAPSPTGFAHVGTAYVALFNYAFAKKNKGKLVLRLEDTDIKRHVEGTEQAIYDGLSWLGLSWDEGPDLPAQVGRGGKFGPYRQSERLEIYKKKAKELLEKDLAYKEEGAVRFRNPGNDVSWNDLIRGEVTFSGGEVTDFVLLKSDGYPTYNFAVVVDDILMEISHVIRGEEHISNTPRQLALYKAFETSPPEFAHLPTLRNKEKKKLSKRRDPVDLRIYKEQGYLPEALVNFLCLLGWSHPEGKEIFNLREFVKLFDLKRVSKAGPIFNTEKLDWLNGQYIQKLSDKEFAEKVKLYAPKKVSLKDLEEIAPLVKTRINKLSEFEKLASALFEDPGRPTKELLKGVNKRHLKAAFEDLSSIDPENWSEKLDETVLATVDKNKFKTGDFFMSLRIAEFSSNATPPVNDSMKFLGQEESLKRIKRLI
jgi:glutamyl-tRNA synthetase